MSNKISLIRSENLAKVSYAYASKVPEGMELLFLAGSCPINKDSKVSLINDFEGQAKLCVDNLKEALEECGASITDVAYTRILVASQDRKDLVKVWNVISDEFGEHDVPSTLSGVTVLGYENQLVEIEAVAAVEKKTHKNIQ
ncbi:RidA family protein [Sedimentibacter saalensis]|uniref:RidA family protein n=1 Tax=Sedimentibacter saalensis TaxID=130788 RepID=UPI0028A2D006|nr:RidA family protein [Sedimentibacter saalensis]